jgi:hypothetical protein
MAKISALSTSFICSVLTGDKKAQKFSFVDEDGQPVSRGRLIDELRGRNEAPELVRLEDAQAPAPVSETPCHTPDPLLWSFDRPEEF